MRHISRRSHTTDIYLCRQLQFLKKINVEVHGVGGLGQLGTAGVVNTNLVNRMHLSGAVCLAQSPGKLWSWTFIKLQF